MMARGGVELEGGNAEKRLPTKSCPLYVGKTASLLDCSYFAM